MGSCGRAVPISPAFSTGSIIRSGTRRAIRTSPPATAADDLDGKKANKAALQRTLGLP
jgi:hypothetical protein